VDIKSVKRKVSTKPVVARQEQSFREIIGLIESARLQAIQTVNTELISLYWRIGEYISSKLETSVWGEGVVDALARYIAKQQPEFRGFTRASLFRMRQFYDTYRHDKKVAPLVRQLSWSHNILILGRCKQSEEREFYLRLCVRERWGKRELERQLNGALFERTIVAPPKVSALLTQIHPIAQTVFKDTYLLDFLDLPDGHSESDLQNGLISNLKRFLLELGRDFTFVGEQYLLQVGGKDFRID
jgi:predicted nuclease of restriction endonuclease-like (RecB) superfamily